MSRKTNKCRLCGEHRHETVNLGPFASFNATFVLLKCNRCSFISTNPLPEKAELDQHYNYHYWSVGTGKKNMAAVLYKFRMLQVIRKIQRLVKKKGRVLDWGCGDGLLTMLLRSNGYESYGIDSYVKVSNDKHIISSTIERAPFPDGFFDAITCFHVLEHILNPVESLRAAFDLLKAGGILILEVPNFSSLGRKLFKSRWQPLEIPTHVNHFTTETLTNLVKHVKNTEILKKESFSHRISPSSLVLSIFPGLAPRNIRKHFKEFYPFPLMVFYLIMQILAYPLAIIDSATGHGGVIRMYIRKTGS